jgi:hypothetical protein
MTDEIERDPARDAVLASALRDMGPEPPMDAVDWDRLERAVAARAVAARAGQRFAALGPGVPWWQPVAAWARPAIPLGLAAGVALLLAVLRVPVGTAEPAEPLLLGDEVAESVYLDDPTLLLRAVFISEGAAFTSEDAIP